METLAEVARIDLFSFLYVAIVIAAAYGLNLLAQRHYAGQAHLQTRLQVLQAVLVLVSLILIILTLPIGESRRGQLLQLLGIVLSAAVALSSTTVLGNAMAGLMLRSIKSYKPGDYIQIGDHAGRVTEMDLMHTEIQTEGSDLTTLSNVFLVTHPYSVISSKAGTIVSVPVSLGYDVPRKQIEKLLIAAIEEAGLEDPFVQILDLGDFSVTYRAAGMLRPVKGLLGMRSRLRATTLDALHRDGVEIVSPTIMTTRAHAPETRFIPEISARKTVEPKSVSIDEVVFAKAKEAESLESMRAPSTSSRGGAPERVETLNSGTPASSITTRSRPSFCSSRMPSTFGPLEADDLFAFAAVEPSPRRSFTVMPLAVACAR